MTYSHRVLYFHTWAYCFLFSWITCRPFDIQKKKKLKWQPNFAEHCAIEQSMNSWYLLGPIFIFIISHWKLSHIMSLKSHWILRTKNYFDGRINNLYFLGPS